MTRLLYTIGYEGAGMDTFLSELTRHNITALVDVRAVPLSRKKGFSKNRLRGFLETENIIYHHFKALGTPREGRVAVKAGDIATMHDVFGKQMQTPEAQAALEEVTQIAQRDSACLLCFERDPAECHRTLVAQALRDRHGFAIRELYVTPL